MLETILYGLALASFIWIAYDVIVIQKKMPLLQKFLWVIFGFFFSVVTAVLYFFVVKKK